MANTNILIKRSSSVGKPSGLLAGELAYSYTSNTIFIGSPTGNGVVNVGGQFYTSQIDSATSQATPSTIVKRDATGNASFNFITANIIGEIIGNANSATQLLNARNFSIDGGDITASAISFNGTGDVVLNASLDAVPSLGAGTYGSTTAIPVIQVAANGRVMNVTTAAISTSFTVAADSGASQTVSGGDTLTLVGGAGITSTASSTDTVTFDVDNTVVRANTPITIQTIDGSVQISGNLTVLGTQTTINTETLNIADPMILLAANNTTSDDLDIGFSGKYFDNSSIRHTGVFRNAGDREFYVFDNYDKDLTGNNQIDVADASFRAANLNTGFVRSTGITVNGINLSSVNNTQNSVISIIQGVDLAQNAAISVIEGVNLTQNNNITAVNNNAASGYAQANTATGIAQGAFDKANAAVFSTTTLTNGLMLIGAGSNNVTTIANVTYTLTGSLSASKTITSLTVDNYGRVSAATGADIAIDTSQITSGTLGYNRGGTGSTTYTTGGLLIAGASGFGSLANTTYTQTGTLTSNNTITSITVDAYGRFTAATVGAISGLTVGQGGTGRNTFTTNGIIYGNSTDGLLVTAGAGTADQSFSNQILTVTNAGVPVWSTALDGGTF